NTIVLQDLTIESGKRRTRENPIPIRNILLQIRVTVLSISNTQKSISKTQRSISRIRRNKLIQKTTSIKNLSKHITNKKSIMKGTETKMLEINTRSRIMSLTAL